MLAMETVVPVYFAVEDDALLSIYEQTQAASASQGSASAAEGGCRGCSTLSRAGAGGAASVGVGVEGFQEVLCLGRWGDPHPGVPMTETASPTSAAAHGHGQRLPDGHEWAAEQGPERLAHHQRGGERYARALHPPLPHLPCPALGAPCPLPCHSTPPALAPCPGPATPHPLPWLPAPAPVPLTRLLLLRDG